MKDLKISKELLSEVLNYEVDAFLGINKNEIDYTCCRDENEGYIDISINLYEFAFKCKEWAYKNEYLVMSGNCETFKETNKYYDSHDNTSILYTFASVRKTGTLRNEAELRGNSEAELIIKACEWILGKEIQEENRLQLQEDLTEYNKLIKEGL